MSVNSKFSKSYVCVSLFCGILAVFSAGEAYAYSGGKGEPNAPYRIATAEDLNDIDNHPNDLNKHFIMVNDINLADYSGTKFNFIGQYSWWRGQGWSFDGIFDGNGHTISNFSYNDRDQESVGIFGYAGPNSVIKNVYVEDANVIGYYWVGTLVALNKGRVSDCRATGTVLGEENVGGLVGMNEEGSVIENCSTNIVIEIKGDDYAFAVGGLVGYNYRGTIEDSFVDVDIECSTETYYTGALAGFNRGTIRRCSAQGNISGGRWYMGGLVGVNSGTGDISACHTTVDIGGGIEGAGGLVGYNQSGHVINSYAMGNVDSDNAAGGLFGYATWGDAVNCYSTGTVTGDVAIGGLVGSEYRDKSTFKSCFWKVDNNPDLNDVGNVGDDPNIIGLSMAAMQDANTYMDGGWDFNTPIWKFCSLPDYPKLGWEWCPGAVERLAELGELVEGLGLSEGVENSLLAKLEAAAGVLEDDNEKNDGAAVNILGAFINAASAQSGKKIAESQADALIAEAAAIIEALESGA